MLPKLKRVGKGSGSGRGSPCQVDIMAFDYSLWMSPLAHPPCPRPILSCLSLSLAKSLLFSGRATKRRPVTAPAAAAAAGQTDPKTSRNWHRANSGCPKVYGRSIMQAPLLKLFHCRAEENSASPIDFYANKILRLLLLFLLLRLPLSLPLSLPLCPRRRVLKAKH